MASINEKPRKRQFLLDLDEDELQVLINWGVNLDPAKYQTREIDNRLHRTLRAALHGATRSPSDDTPVAPAKRSAASSVSSETADRQRGNKIDTGEGMTWTERD